LFGWFQVSIADISYASIFFCRELPLSVMSFFCLS
jgi:hypothetical protein